MDRILLIDKEVGWTSNDVVRKLKGVLQPKKIGHAGTLDPFATGLLLIMLDEGTKKFDELLKLKKEYIVEIEFGKITDTDDVTGKTIWEYDEKKSGKIDVQSFSQAELSLVLQKFKGKIWQVPPKFSALKINGKPAYKFAYKLKDEEDVSDLQKQMESKKRQVEVYEIEVLKVDEKNLTLRFVVSSGTYIRTLAKDIGQELGLGAFAKSLRRTKIGEYSVENATQVGQVKNLTSH